MTKPVRMMILENCPHCRRAFQMMEELKAVHPEYEQVEIEIIDEARQPESPESLDYYYVPTFFVDGVKVHEGVPSMEAVDHMFREALGQAAAIS